MSAFLEEYGKVIVVIVVIAALIVLATIFKRTGSENANQSFNAFMGIADDSVQKAEQAAKGSDTGN